MYLTIRNLSGDPDVLVSARTPASARVVLTRNARAEQPAPARDGLRVPAHGRLTLSPFGSDLVLLHPAALMSGQRIPLTLIFREAGRVTVTATVTAPGSP
jgi:copper(I)-binding protein